MSLTTDERKWLDEKFKNLHSRIDSLGNEQNRQRDWEQKINVLEVEIAKRPTMSQLFGASATAFALGLSAMGVIVLLI